MNGESRGACAQRPVRDKWTRPTGGPALPAAPPLSPARCRPGPSLACTADEQRQQRGARTRAARHGLQALSRCHRLELKQGNGVLMLEGGLQLQGFSPRCQLLCAGGALRMSCTAPAPAGGHAVQGRRQQRQWWACETCTLAMTSIPCDMASLYCTTVNSSRGTIAACMDQPTCTSAARRRAAPPRATSAWRLPAVLPLACVCLQHNCGSSRAQPLSTRSAHHHRALPTSSWRCHNASEACFCVTRCQGNLCTKGQTTALQLQQPVSCLSAAVATGEVQVLQNKRGKLQQQHQQQRAPPTV